MSVSLISSSACGAPQSASRCLPSSYERNALSYGPVVANALGAGQALADGASATVSFSEEALGRVADSVEAASSTITQHISDAVTSAYGGVANAASDVGEAVSSVGKNLGAYAAIGAQIIREAV